MSDLIVASLLDTDLYKYTMAQAVFHRFGQVDVEYTFRCRTHGVELAPLLGLVEQQVKGLGTLSLSDSDMDFLRQIPALQDDFLTFMQSFQLDPSLVHIGAMGKDLEIKVKGPWLDTIFFEIPILAIVSEAYVIRYGSKDEIKLGREKLMAKKKLLLELNSPSICINFADFGTRRRASLSWQGEVLQTLSGLPGFIGTSNLYYAKELKLKPIGTMAHEFLQACQVLAPSLRQSQIFALEQWADEYQKNLGVALSDVVGADAFFRDFNGDLAKRYDGCRHDSGDPLAWSARLIEHYRSLGIDPRQKKAVYSNGIDFSQAIEIYRSYGDELNVSFGIGTNLTNDRKLAPISIVMKMTRCLGQPVAKLSDSPGKFMCDDPVFVEKLRQTFSSGND